MKDVPKAGGIVVNSKGEVLVITNDLGRRTLPKGTPEAGEKAIDTARREIHEETGLKNFTIHEELGTIIREGYTDTNHQAPSVIKHIRMFLCTTAETELQPQTSDVIKAEWVRLEDIDKILSWPEEIEFIKQHRAKLRP